MSRVTHPTHDIFSLVSDLFSLSSSFCARFSLLSSLLGTEPFLHHPAPRSSRVSHPSLLSSLFFLLSSLCSLPSSLLSLLSSLLSLLSTLFSLLSSLFSLSSSLAAAHFSDRTAHLSLRTLHQAIDSASTCIHSTLCLTIPGPAECAKR